jgi:hypothetical protein
MNLALASNFVEMSAENLADAETRRLRGLIKARTVILNRHSYTIDLYLDSDRHGGIRGVLLHISQRSVHGTPQLF